MKKTALRKKSVLRNYIYSYMIVVLIPIGACVMIYISTYNVMKNEMTGAKFELLRYFATEMDYQTVTLSQIASSLSQNQNLKQFAMMKEPLTTLQKHQLQTFAKNEFSFGNYQETFAKYYFLYLPNSNYAVRYGGYSDINAAYDEYVPNKGITRNEWKLILNSRYHKGFISLGGEDILYIYSIGDFSGNVLMNFCVVINNKYLSDIGASLNYSEQGAFLMVNDDDKIIYSRNFDAEANPFSYQELSEQGKGEIRQINGRSMVVSWLKSNMLNVKYIWLVPANEFWDKAVNTKMIFIFGTITAILVALGFALWFSYRHYRPIMTLTRILDYSDGVREDEQKFIVNAVKDIISEQATVRRQIEEDEQQRQKLIMSRILAGKHGSHTYQEILGKYRINFPQGCYTVIIFSLDDYESFFDDSHTGRYEYMVEYAVIRVVEEFISRHYICNITQVSDHIVCIVNFSELSKQDVDEELTNMMEILKDIIQNELYIQITVAISGLHSSVDELHMAYTEAHSALEKRIVIGENSIIRYSPGDADNRNMGYVYYLETEVKLLNNIKQGNKAEAFAILDKIFEDNLAYSKLSVDMIKYLMHDLAGTVFKAIVSLNYVKVWGGDLMSWMPGCSTVLETKKMLKDVIGEVCDFVNSEKKSHNVALKDNIIDYINANYSDPNLCNSQIAEQFDIKASYLSVFFKEQMGENILSYIHKVRMHKAKALFEDNDYTLEEVGKMVGYNNAVALIRNFKKYEGITPGEFKNKLTRKHEAGDKPDGRS